MSIQLPPDADAGPGRSAPGLKGDVPGVPGPGGGDRDLIPGGFIGSRSSDRVKSELLGQQGGNARSEAAVARGLEWLALHQASDGHWSLHEFNHTAREKPRPAGKVFRCSCETGTTNRNDVAATQVMHHMQGEAWRFWNLGPGGTGKGGIRDTLIAKQDKGDLPGKAHQAGSWGGSQGGRMMATSLSLLCLEVYYRHLPLYRRDREVLKEEK
jgi:hypothetical protein